MDVFYTSYIVKLLSYFGWNPKENSKNQYTNKKAAHDFYVLNNDKETWP